MLRNKSMEEIRKQIPKEVKDDLDANLNKQYDNLKLAFVELLNKYSPNNKICRNAWLIKAGLKEPNNK